MRRQHSLLFTAILLAGLILSLNACGSDGGGGADTSPYAGHWVGNWTDSVISQNGSLDITISAIGKVTGTVHNNTTGGTGPVTGFVDNSGNIAAYYAYPSQTYKITGSLSINGSGHLVGSTNTFTYPGEVSIGTATTDLIKQ